MERKKGKVGSFTLSSFFFAFSIFFLSTHIKMFPLEFTFILTPFNFQPHFFIWGTRTGREIKWEIRNKDGSFIVEEWSNIIKYCVHLCRHRPCPLSLTSLHPPNQYSQSSLPHISSHHSGFSKFYSKFSKFHSKFFQDSIKILSKFIQNSFKAQRL